MRKQIKALIVVESLRETAQREKSIQAMTLEHLELAKRHYSSMS